MRTRTRRDKHKTYSKIVYSNPFVSIITLHIYCLSSPIKKWRFSDWIENKN